MSHSSAAAPKYRSYRDSDEPLIDRLLRSAFVERQKPTWSSPCAGKCSLRGKRWRPTRTGGGHVFFSPITLERDGKNYLQGWALAPLAVDPDFQCRESAPKLVRLGLEASRKSFCPFVLVLGDPRFYGRFGFQSELAQPWSNPFGQGPFVMAWTFGNPKNLAFSERVRYARPFEDLLSP